MRPVQLFKPTLWPAVLLLFGAACGGLFETSPSYSEQDIDAALKQAQQGEVEKALERLRQIENHRPDDPVGDRAALVLGNLLIQQNRHADALAPLRRARQGVVGPHYAAILLVRAILRGELADHYQEAAEQAEGLMESQQGAGDLLLKEARFSLIQLDSLRSNWMEAARRGLSFLSQHPDSGESDEVRWLTAEALRRSDRPQAAYDLYADLWYDSPRSRWALEAKRELAALVRARAVRPRDLSADERYRFVQRLRSAALHGEAIEEIGIFLKRHPAHPKTDGALFMQAMSYDSLRQNENCVNTVQRLRRVHPSSRWVPNAVIVAIRALRRNDNTPQIRGWVDWIQRRYPRHPKSYEALYNWGTYQTNVVGKEKGLETLRRLVRTAGDHPDVPDAYWKIAWILRNQGKTEEAVDTLRQLLQRFPKTGYRPAALYWLGRFTAELNRSEAVAYFRECLRDYPHHYYGHQSRENLTSLGAVPDRVGSSQPFPPVDRLTDPSAYSSSSGGYVRAVHLKTIGLYGFAAQELLSEPGLEDNPSLQFALAELYSRSGDPWRAIDILNQNFPEFAREGSRDPNLVPREFWEVLYPFYYQADIRSAIQEAGLEGTRIDPFLIAALIRLESRFLPTAISPVGAIGLMQLMPATAEEIARGRGLAPPSRPELFTPPTNIRYGVYYLAQLTRRFEGDWFPAICSYNAGPAAARWWRQKPADQKQDEFIENILFRDTRLYIKQILGDYRNYEWIYAQEPLG